MAQKEVKFTVSADDKASATVKQIEKAFDSLKEHASSLLELLAGFGIALGFGEFFKTAVEQATEADSAMRRLEVSVKNAGDSFEVMKPKIDQTVEGLAKTTTYKPDQLVAGLQALITVTGNTAESVKAMGLVTDIAAAKHMDLEQAATLVGRVIDGNTGMLKRYGIVINDGDDALAVMQARFSGFAANEAQTFGGQLTKLKNGWDEFTKAVGEAIIGNDAMGQNLQGTVGFLAQLEQFVKANEDTLGDLVTVLATVAGWLGTGLKDALTLITGGFLGFNLLIETVVYLLFQFYNEGRSIFGSFAIVIGQWLEQTSGFFEAFGINTDAVGAKIANFGLSLQRASFADHAAQAEQLGASSAKMAEFVKNGFASATGAVKDHTDAQDALHSTAVENGAELEKLRNKLDDLATSTANGKTKAQEFVIKMREWQLAAQAAGMSNAEVDAGMKRLTQTLKDIKIEESTKAFNDLEAALLEATGDPVQKVVAELGKKLDELKLKQRGVTDPAEIIRYQQELDRLTTMYDAQVQAVAAVTDAQEKLRVLHDWEFSHPLFGVNGANAISDLDAYGKKLSEVYDDLQKRLNDPNLTAGGKKQIEDELAKIDALFKQWGEAMGQHYETLSKTMSEAQSDWVDKMSKSIDAAAQFARWIDAIANSMGLMDDKTRVVIDDVINLVDSIGKLMANPADIGSWLQAIGSLGDLISKGMGGETAAEKAARLKVQFDNTVAIDKLTERVGEVGLVNASGASVDKAWENAQSIVTFLNQQSVQNKTKVDLSQWNPADITNLKDVAKALGITIDDTAGSWRQLKEALDVAAGHLINFSNDFSGQSKLGQIGADLFDLQGVQAIQAHYEAAFDTSTLFRNLFGGKSILEAVGADNGASVKDAIRALFTRIQSGETFGPDQLGSMTGNDFITALQGLYDEIKGLPAATTGGSGASSALSSIAMPSLSGVTASSSLSFAGGLASASYSQFDDFTSVLKTIAGDVGAIRSILERALNGAIASVSMVVNQSVTSAAATASSDADQSLALARTAVRQAAGVPRTF